MYSFYGGRPGNSFVIITTFNSKDQMIRAFQDGPNYTKVHYGEHVLINTENKNNPENGQIYRRGYDFNNDMGGAEYIGTIVGPAGPAPKVELLENGSEAPSGDEVITTSQDLTVSNESLVPGNENDSINIRAYSVRDSNNKDTTLYLQFKVPYPVIDFDTQIISPYDENGNRVDEGFVTRTDNGNHPFYEKWKFGIPKGVKGNSFTGLQVKKDSNELSGLYYTELNYDGKEAGQATEKRLGDYNIINDISLDENTGLFTISYTNGTLKKTLKWIKEINISESGVIQAINTNNESRDLNANNPIQYIKNIQQKDNGTIQVTYNTIDETTQTNKTAIINGSPIQYINNIEIDNDNGRPADLIVTYNTVDDQGQPITQRFENALKSISNISLDEDGSLVITYNTIETMASDEDGEAQTVPETITFPNALKSINDISLSNDGKLTIFYNTSETIEDEDGQQTIIGQQINTPIKWINNISKGTGDATGDLIVTYNTNETDILENALDVPTGININAQSQKLQVSYRAANHASEQIGDAINFITEATIDRRGRLLMRFSDPNYTSSIPGQNEKTDLNGDGNNVWNYLGTVSAQDLGFKENQTTITNKYLSGIINNQSQLIFDLNTNQFLSNKITVAEISNCSIKVYNKNTADYSTPLFSIIIDENGSSHTNTISPDLFGLHCIFNNVGVSVQQDFIPVDILIENIEFNFTIDDSSATSESVEQKVEGLIQQANVFDERIKNTQTALTEKQNTITGGASTITSNNLTASRALVSDRSGKVAISTTTATQLGYVHGVTSNIQTQLNNKQGTINLTASKALISNASGKVAVSTTTATQLGYVHGVTSAIQTQLNNKGIKNTFTNTYPSAESGGNGYPNRGTLKTEEWKTVHSISLTAGDYLLNGVITFDQVNGNGVRVCQFSKTKTSKSYTSSNKINRFAFSQILGNPNGYSRLRITYAYRATATETLYFNAQQTSGKTLSYDDVGVQIIKLA